MKTEPPSQGRSSLGHSSLGRPSLTTGNPAWRIIVFTIPLLAGEIFQLLYSMADAFILGRILGINALAAVGAATSLVFMVFGLAIGLTGGFVVITAQRVGAGSEEGIRRSVAAGLSLSLFFSLLISAVLLPLTRPLLSLMRTPSEIINDASAYALIIAGGITITLFSNMFAGIIQASGDSFTPFVFFTISSVLNIGLDVLFIVVFRWGVPGAAVATVFSQLVSCLFGLIFLFRRCGNFIPRRGEWLVGKKELATHLALGLSMALQRCIVEVGNMLVQTAMNSLGTVTIGAVSAGQKIRALNMMPFFALSRSVTTYTAQNFGANRMDRVNKGLAQSCLICLAGGIFTAILNRTAGGFFASLFIRDSAEGIALAHQYIVFSGYTVTILGLMLIFRSALQGLGARFAPILCSIMETVVSILAAFVLIPRLGFTGVCLVNPLSWLASFFPAFIGYLLVGKKR